MNRQPGRGSDSFDFLDISKRFKPCYNMGLSRLYFCHLRAKANHCVRRGLALPNTPLPVAKLMPIGISDSIRSFIPLVSSPKSPSASISASKSTLSDTTWKLMFFQTKSDTLNTSNPNLLPFGNVECGLRNRNQVDLTINTNRHVEIISPLEGWRFTNTT